MMRVFFLLMIMASLSFSFSVFMSLNYDGSSDVTLRGREGCYGIPSDAVTESCGENCMKFSTNQYTGKEGAVWTASYIMLCEGEFTIRFPAGARLVGGDGEAYVKDGLLYLSKEASEGDELTFAYTFFREESNPEVGIASIILIITGAVILYFLSRSKKAGIRREDTEKKLELFPDPEKKIVTILRERDAITQKELEAVADMPKSTLSRTLNRLEEKGFVERKKVGLSKKIFLTEELKKIIK